MLKGSLEDIGQVLIGLADAGEGLIAAIPAPYARPKQQVLVRPQRLLPFGCVYSKLCSAGCQDQA